MKESKKNFLSALSIFIVVLLILGGLLWQAGFSGLEKEKQKYVENRTALSEMEQKIDQKTALQKDFQSKNRDIEVVEKSLLNANDSLKFIEEVESLAVSAGNQYAIDRANEVYQPKTNKLQQINFTLNLSGDFNSIMEFLRGVNNLPYLTDIPQFSVNTPAGGSGNLDVDLELQVFIK